MKKRLSAFLLLAILAYGAYLFTLDESRLPPLHDGDLVFQTTWTNQSIAIGLATGSVYIHTGIVEMVNGTPQVIDAGRTVRESSLHSWIDGGILKRFSVYRYKGLTPKQMNDIIEAAKKYIGKPYDYYFSFDNDAVYCSELPYLSFRDAGFSLGATEKIGSLYVNNRFVKKLIEQRWRQYPKCEGKNLTFDQCYDIIMSQELISPTALAHDPHLDRIFTNYP